MSHFFYWYLYYIIGTVFISLMPFFDILKYGIIILSYKGRNFFYGNKNLTNLNPSHAKRIEEKDVSHKKALVIIYGVTVKMFGFSGILCVQALNFIAQNRMSLEILYFPHIEINTQQDRSTPHSVSVCAFMQNRRIYAPQNSIACRKKPNEKDEHILNERNKDKHNNKQTKIKVKRIFGDL